MSELLCKIEIWKEGRILHATTEMPDGTEKEFDNPNFEDLLSEMRMTLEEQLVE